jgi:hypothetical protein
MQVVGCLPSVNRVFIAPKSFPDFASNTHPKADITP